MISALLPAPSILPLKTLRDALSLLVLTALMGCMVSFQLALRGHGFQPGFFSEWWSEFVSICIFLGPIAFVVGLTSKLVMNLVLSQTAPPTATGGSPPPVDAVIRDSTQFWNDNARAVEGRVMLVNLFTPKSGKAEEFIHTQSAEYVRLKGKVEGFVENRLGRAVDGTDRIANVAIFETIEAYLQWRKSRLFAEHMDIIRPLVDTSVPGIYSIVYDSDDVGALKS